MVGRYAMEVFHRYCEVRRLSPAEARAELERFDNLVLVWGQRASGAGRWVTGPARTAKHPFGSRSGLVNAS
jgi:hypothetical protein